MLRRVLLVIVLAAGCSDEVDLSGMYVVDSDVAGMPCGEDEPVANGPAYVKFTRGELFGTPYFSYAACTDAAGADCASLGGLFGGFFEPIDGGWLGRTTFSSGGGASCSLGLREQTATLGGNQLVIEGHTYQEVVELPEDRCTPEEAERRGAAMPCTEHERLAATRL